MEDKELVEKFKEKFCELREIAREMRKKDIEGKISFSNNKSGEDYNWYLELLFNNYTTKFDFEKRYKF